MSGLSMQAMSDGFWGAGGGRNGLGGSLASIYQTQKMDGQMTEQRALLRDSMLLDNSHRTKELGLEEKKTDLDHQYKTDHLKELARQANQNHEVAMGNMESTALVARANASNTDAKTQGQILLNVAEQTKQTRGAVERALDAYTRIDQNDPVAVEAFINSVAPLLGGTELVSTRPTAVNGAKPVVAVNPESNTTVLGFQNPGEEPVPLTEGAVKWGDGNAKAVSTDTGKLLTQTLTSLQTLAGSTDEQLFADLVTAQGEMEKVIKGGGGNQPQQPTHMQKEISGEKPGGPQGLKLAPAPAPGPSSVNIQAKGLNAANSLYGKAASANMLEGQPMSSQGQLDAQTYRDAHTSKVTTENEIAKQDASSVNEIAKLEAQSRANINEHINEKETMTPGEKSADKLLAEENSVRVAQVQQNVRDVKNDTASRNMVIQASDVLTKQLSADKGFWNNLGDVLAGEKDTAWENRDHMVQEVSMILRDPQQRKLLKDLTGVDVDEYGMIHNPADARKVVEIIGKSKAERRGRKSMGILSFPWVWIKSIWTDSDQYGQLNQNSTKIATEEYNSGGG